jgi:hypothetical protein
MGVVTMTIDGADVLSYLQFGLSSDASINGRPNLRCKLRVRDGDSYRPSIRDEVELTVDGDVVFGGIVWSVRETDVIDYKHRDLDVECTGYEALADVTVFNGNTAADNLKDALTDVAVSLSPHGITVDSGMASGPAIGALAYPFMTVRESLDMLALASEWNWKFDHEKHVLFEDPGTVGAPFALDESNSTILALETTTSLANYTNDVWLLFGNDSAQAVSDGWTGDGSTKTFALHYFPAVTPGIVFENSVAYPVALWGQTGYRWYYDASVNSLKVDAGEAAPTNGHIITSDFQAQFPGLYVSQNASEYSTYGPWTTIVRAPEIFEWTQARYAADGELARRQGVVRRIKAETSTAGLKPGMTVNVTASKRGLSSVNFLIERVSMRHQTKTPNGEHLFFYEIDAVEGNQYQQNWIEYFRSLSRGASAGGGGTVSGGSGSSSGTVVVAKPYWGGSRQAGVVANNTWVDAREFVPVRIDGGSGSGSPVTVRAYQRTANAATSVQVRVVRSDTTAAMTTGATSTSTGWDEELLTFTPAAGVLDYHLQIKGSNGSNQVYAIATTL